MPFIAFFISSSEISAGSYSTKAVRPGRLIAALFIPLSELSFFSIFAAQAAHAMPTTGIFFFSIIFSLNNIIILYSKIRT